MAGKGRKRKTDAAGDAGLLGTTEAARELGVTPATLRRWITEGRLPAQRVGKKWRVRRADLRKVVQLQDAAPAEAPPPLQPRQARQSEQQIDKLLSRSGLGKARAAELAASVESQVLGSVEQSDPVARRLLAKLLVGAVHATVSDLHIEPFADGVKVRQRIDGALMEAVELPRELARSMIDEVMRWSGMNLNARRVSQNGRFAVRPMGSEIDVRVNVMPTIYGGVVALRILDRQVALPALDRLGFEPDQLERYRSIIQRPNGLILVTAPTGAGKTTTLYATLSELNDPSRKILTAEDPVEYALPGINQAAIDESVGFGFREAAIAMLRQAPNIMFIGEIRGVPTGQLLCQAALTGHLVFSTLHTDDAVSAVIRLLDMGVEPVLVSSAVACVVGQRLVRLICRHCKTEHRPEERDLDVLRLEGEDRARPVYYGKGCEQCHGTGYRGRTAIYQLLEFTPEVRSAVLGQDRDGLAGAARSAGYRSLREVALAKLFRGETTVEEIVRETCIAGRAQMI